MAIWQFKFALAPRSGIRKIHGKNMPVLKEYGERDLQVASEDKVFPNYWAGMDDSRLTVMQAVQQLLPESDSWSKDARMFGDDERDHVEVWDDDICCAIDLRNFPAQLLQKFLEVSSALDLQLVIYGSGEVVNPDLDTVVEKIECSSAYKFCLDPHGFFRR